MTKPPAQSLKPLKHQSSVVSRRDVALLDGDERLVGKLEVRQTMAEYSWLPLRF